MADIEDYVHVAAPTPSKKVNRFRFIVFVFDLVWTLLMMWCAYQRFVNHAWIMCVLDVVVGLWGAFDTRRAWRRCREE